MADPNFTLSGIPDRDTHRKGAPGRSRPRRTGLSSRARPLSASEVRQWQAALERIEAARDMSP